MSQEGRKGSGGTGADRGIDSPQGGAWRKLLFYGSSRAVSQGLVSIRGIALASLLGPGPFGLWTLFRLGMLYGSFPSLGVARGLELEVAQAPSHEQGTGEHAASPVGTAFGLTLLLSGVVGLAALVASLLVSDSSWALGLRIFAAVLVLESLIVCALTYLRASGQLKRFGITEVIFAGVHLCLAVLLALRWGLSGSLLGYLVASLLLVPVVFRQVPFSVSFSIAEARHLLGVGLPVALTSMLGFALLGIDRLVVGAFAGLRQLGLYAFAVSVSGLTASVAWVVRTVVMPEVYASAKDDGAPEALRQHLGATIVPFARLYPVVVGLLAIALGPAVALLLPQYIEAVSAARIVVFLGVTAGFVSLGSLGVVAAGKQRVLPVMSAVALIANALFSLLALRLGFGIEGVAVATLLTRSALGIGILTLVAQTAGLVGGGRFVGRVTLPLLGCAAAVLALDRWLGATDVRSALQALVAYLVLVSPFLPVLLRSLRIDEQRI